MSEPRPNAASRRVGELAAASGVTVRTLHYWGEIGLLEASRRTGAGHRLYSDGDVERLYRICLLQRLGLSLHEIADALDDPAWDLRATVSAHLRDLERRLEAENRLRGRLTGLLARTDTVGSGRLTDDLLDTLEEMTMLEAAVKQRISILVYADLEAAYDFLVRVFGLGPGELTRDAAGLAIHGELEAGDGVVWLHPESTEFGLASPQTVGAATAMMAVMVDDVDVHHRQAVEHGAVVDYGPVDQPYGYREYGARDSEGGLWSFMKPLGR